MVAAYGSGMGNVVSCRTVNDIGLNCRMDKGMCSGCCGNHTSHKLLHNMHNPANCICHFGNLIL